MIPTMADDVQTPQGREREVRELEVQKLELLTGLYEVAIGRLFETVPGGDEAKRRFAADVRQLLEVTRERQPDGLAVQTYEALLRRLGAAPPDAAGGLGVVPTPEQGLPPSGSGA